MSRTSPMEIADSKAVAKMRSAGMKIDEGDARKEQKEARQAKRGTARPEPFNRCPMCGSSEIRYRSRGDNYLCRRCGNVWKVHDSPKKGKVKK